MLKRAARSQEEEGARSEGASSEVHYRAFVSYRHADVDSAVAAAVQRGLERYWVPKSARGADGSAHIAPVFRDKEELPVSSRLGDDIEAALRGADSLVVICSPRTQESSWVAREIELFLSCHDRDRVFVVLAEGEPAEVIPDRLLHETRVVTTSDGTTCEETVDLEPLACDFRASARRERRTELTRLAAAILGVRFDSLMRRAQRRRMRIGAAAAAVITAVAVGIASYALWSNARIQENYEQALQQQSQYLTTSAREALEGGDRLKAIELASAALPADGEDRPLYPDALRALAEATLSYTDGGAGRDFVTAGLEAKYRMTEGVDAFATSEDGHLLAAIDTKRMIRAWDLQTDECLFEAQAPALSDYRTPVLTNDGLLVVVAEDGALICYDLAAGEEPLWRKSFVPEAEGEDSKNYFSCSYRLLLASQDQLIVLGHKAAHLVDLHTPAILKSVPYRPQSPYNISINVVPGGLNHATQQLIVDCYEWGYELDEEGNETDELHKEHTALLVDFSAGASTPLGIRANELESALYVTDGPMLKSVLYLNDGTMLASYRVDYNYESTYVIIDDANGLPIHQTSQCPYVRATSRIDLASSKVLWSRETTAYGAPFMDAMIDLGAEVEALEGHHVVAHCFADVCELLDADDGMALGRFEATAPFVLVWPCEPGLEPDPQRYLLNAVLYGGVGCGLRLFEGKAQTHNDPSYYIAPSDDHAMRLSPSYYIEPSDDHAVRLSDGVLLLKDATFYRYADMLEGDDAREICQSTRYVEGSYSTACGVLLIESESDSEGNKTWYISLLDSVSGGVAWKRTYYKDEDWYQYDIIGDPTDSNHLFLYGRSRGSDAHDCVFTIDLSNGTEESYEVAGGFLDEEEWLGSMLNCDLSSAYTSASHYAVSLNYIRHTTSTEPANGDASVTTEDEVNLATIDLLTGKTALFPLSDLSDYSEYFAGSYEDLYGGVSWSLSPTGRQLLISLEDPHEDGDGDEYVFTSDLEVKPLVSCGLLDLETHRLVELPEGVRPDVYGSDSASYDGYCCAVWADDGSRFACATQTHILLYDSKGTQIGSFPLSGRELVTLRLLDERMLVVCLDEGEVLLLAYDISGRGLVGRCTLPGIEDYMLSADRLTWIKSSSGERDPGDMCLLPTFAARLYVISTDPFGVCQVIADGCVGYEDETRTIVTQERQMHYEGDEQVVTYTYLARPRHTIDDLLERGQQQVGASAMTSAERQAYGLEAAE